MNQRILKKVRHLIATAQVLEAIDLLAQHLPSGTTYADELIALRAAWQNLHAQRLSLANDAYSREAYLITQTLLNLMNRLPNSSPASQPKTYAWYVVGGLCLLVLGMWLVPKLLPKDKLPSKHANQHDTSRTLPKRAAEKPIIKTEYHIKGNGNIVPTGDSVTIKIENHFENQPAPKK